MKYNYENCLEHILSHEGGWSNNPLDPGGATNQGITLRTYRRHFPGATKNDLRNMTDERRDFIYRVDYWDEVRSDKLPSGIDLMVFDSAVNQGPARARKFLQRAAGTSVDGVLGPLSFRAIRSCDPIDLIVDVANLRDSHYAGLSIFKTFGRGWTRRVNRVIADSVLLAEREK